MRSTFSDGPRRLFRDSSNPLTHALIAAMIFVFLSAFVGSFTKFSLVEWLTLNVPGELAQPWRLLTFSVVEGNPIGLIFGALVLWWVGGSLERSWGTRTFAIFYTLICLVTAISFVPVALMTEAKSALVPGSLVLSALVVGWAMLNPDETINLYGIIPIKSRFIALGIVLITFFTYGWGNPIVGFLALSSCGFAALWARQGWSYGFGTLLPGVARVKKRPSLRLVPSKTPKPKDDRFTMRDLNPLEMMAKRRRRKQFEKLMSDD